jgi:hypothetical protein
MNVAELIKALQRFDQDLVVLASEDGKFAVAPVTSIQQTTEGLVLSTEEEETDH